MRTSSQGYALQSYFRMNNGQLLTSFPVASGVYYGTVVDTDVTNDALETGYMRVVVPAVAPDEVYGTLPYPGTVAPPAGTTVSIGFSPDGDVIALNFIGWGGGGGGGSQGPQGAQGAAGAQGFQGVRGFQGFQGTQGATGIYEGDTAPSDISLIWADTGTPTAVGPQGYQGPQGVQGFQGYQGSQGIYTSHSTPPTDTSLMWLDLDATGAGAQGPQGYQGSTGPQGPQGSVGAQGVQGTQGTTGAQGPQGAQGTQGSQGTTGAQGATGAQGPQGYQGVGIPTGGTTGQALIKNSGTNYDTGWQSQLPLSGGTMSGAINMGSNRVTNLSSSPAALTDAAQISSTTFMTAAAFNAFTAWTAPVDIANGTFTLIQGTVYFSAIYIPYTMSVSNISVFLGSAGVGLTNSYVGLYNSTSQIGVSAAITTSWQTTGLKVHALTATTTGSLTNLTPGVYWVGFLVGNGSTTSPQLARHGAVSGLFINMNNTSTTNTLAAGGKGLTGATGATSLPTGSLGTLSVATTILWAGLS